MNHLDEQHQLEDLRKQIDLIDRDILQEFKKRFQVVEKISQIKKRGHLPVLNLMRKKEIEKLYLTHANELQLNHDFVARLYELVHVESVRIQNE